MVSFTTMITTDFDAVLFRQALGIMGKGMVGIFIVILFIWLVVALLNRFTNSRDKEQ